MSGPPHSFQSSFVNSQQNQMRNQFVGGAGPPMPGLMTPSQQQMMANQQNFGVGMPAVNNQQLQLQIQQQQQQQQQQLQQLQQQQQQVHQQQVQQQQAQQQQVSGVTPAPGTAAPPNQNKEFNTASLCRFGQETVQDIVSRAQELFQNLKVIQPPNGTAQSVSASNEKRMKIQDHLRTIKLLFKRLRLIYEKCNESCQTSGMEYMHIESLIPMKEEWDNKCEERKTSEQYRLACEESKEVMEQVMLKNRHLKELIDHLRRIIWEINAMLAMRRS